MLKLNYTHILTTFIFIFLITSCSSNKPFHNKPHTAGNCSNSQLEECHKSYYQEYPGYDLAFAEFTERGNVFNSLWIDETFKKIADHEKNTGVVIVVFVHGWKHNADETDPNLIDFKKILGAISSSENSPLYGRKLIGLYVGWKGSSLDLGWLENITYWDRKTVAEEVGKGGVTKLLLGLEDIYKNSHESNHMKNVLVTVGHSFGGAIVVNAVTDILTGRTAMLSHTNEKNTANSIGDTIIVINPAIEANQTLPLIESAINANYIDKQNPLFISISTDADSATHYTFPLGQTLGLLFTWHQANLERDYYHDRKSTEVPVLKEEHLDTTTVGNFAPYLTHYLSSKKEVGQSKPGLNLESCDEKPELCKPKGITSLSGYPTISPLPQDYPFYFIKTDDTIMTGHNDIFNDTMRAFIITLIDDIVRKDISMSYEIKSKEADQTRKKFILSDKKKLNERFKIMYHESKK